VRDTPGVAILMLSQHVETHQLLELLGDHPAGVGYLLKDRIPEVERFLESVRLVAAGESVIDPEVVRRLVGKPRRASSVARLSDKEHQVLALMAEGRSNRGIAQYLFLSVKTVETHVAGIFGKLGLPPAPDQHRRVLAVLRYLHDQ